MAGTTATAEQQDQIYELYSRGDMTISAIARAVGLSRDIVKAIIEPPPDVPRDMEYKDYFWPHVAPPPPSAPAAEVLDWRLSPRERAARQHGKKASNE